MMSSVHTIRAMGTERLAIFGGSPVIPGRFAPYPSVGAAEREAVCRVIDSGVLSGFYGSWGEEFFGGPVVRAFEQAWSERFEVRFTVSVNSATSGLIAAIGAVGIEPGDEVIVPPNTMSATVMAPLFYGGIPVFADIDPQTFCLSAAAVRTAITPKTKAIVAVNQFGHPAPLAELRAIADQHRLWLIEDNAQAPLAREHGRYSGTVGHIGVFSLNYHKHIHTGEGGMCVTDDEELAQRLRMIRNHGENVVEALGVENLANLVGFNFRMTELSAAVGLEQLKAADGHVSRRQRVAEALTTAVDPLDGLTPAHVRPGCSHVYYAWTMRFDESRVGVSRRRFSEALSAEGFPNFVGGVRPLYLLPLFQKRIAFGSRGYPFTLSDRKYDGGLCPAAERVYERELLAFETCAYELNGEQVDLLVRAIGKVHAHRELLAAADSVAPSGTR